jgi:biopolymer transport protein ExbB
LGKNVFELLNTGGWLIWPILFCSVAAFAIIIDKFLNLQRSRVLPVGLYKKVEKLIQQEKISKAHLNTLAAQSPLGSLFSITLQNAHLSTNELKAVIEDSGRHHVHDLERYLNTLGSVAAITPLLGLLGTVVGMIKVFTAITAVGVGDAQALSAGISQALITTAAGLSVAIPSLLFYRHFKSRIQTLAVEMEREVMKLLSALGKAAQ